MCTVTFLPVRKTEYILTANRDESVVRAAAVFPVRNDGVLYPKDGHAGGTWIAASTPGKAVCLLNGAFTKHQHTPPYRKSRGLIVLSAFTYPNFKTFASDIELDNIEPFTLVMLENSNGSLYELRWDGYQKHFTSLKANRPHFWCSVTLYSPEIYEKREKWFETWALNQQYTLNNILHFHQFGGDGDKENDLVVNRGEVLKTLSISSIHLKREHPYMIYMDLQKGITFQELL